MRSCLLLCATTATAAAHTACHDRPSCLALVARFEAQSLASPRGALLPKAWHRAVSAVKALAASLPDRGGALAAPAHKADPSNFCADNGPFEFIPIHVGTVFPNSTAKLDLRGQGFNPCYHTMDVDFRPCAPGEGAACDPEVSGYVHFTRPLPRSATCDDFYGVGTKFGSHQLDISVAGSVLKPMHINYTYAPHELEDIRRNGLAINVAPCGLAGTAASAVSTLLLFSGPNASAVVDKNAEFLVSRGLFDAPLVPFDRLVPLDFGRFVRSGDTLAVLKLDGLDPLIAWGTGGRTGHTTIAAWEGDQLYVCESTDVSPTGAYWPPPYGVIRTPWEEWLQLADEAGFSVVVLPLAPAASAAFDEAAYWAWFRTVAGMPYGYHVMLFSFLDTFPNANLPRPIDDRIADNSFLKLDKLIGHDDEPIGANMYALLVEGLNKRLGTACVGNSSFACMSYELLQRNLSYTEATCIPENDDWRYEGNVSMMCSAFVAHGLKAALGSYWPALNAHEFTPKDVYQLRIYDEGAGSTARFNASNCPGGLIVDAGGAYCQLLGPFELPLNSYNSVPVYAHMNEKCAAQWPDYKTQRPC